MGKGELGKKELITVARSLSLFALGFTSLDKVAVPLLSAFNIT